MIFQVKPPVKPPFIRDFRLPATFDYRLMPRMSIEEAQWPTQLVWISWRGSKLGYLWIHICDICLHGGLSKNMVALNPLICIGLPSYIYIHTYFPYDLVVYPMFRRIHICFRLHRSWPATTKTFPASFLLASENSNPFSCKIYQMWESLIHKISWRSLKIWHIFWLVVWNMFYVP
jgi:hypothetical protein